MSTLCPLCDEIGGELVWQNDFARVILADEANYPGFCRVILQRHTAEMTDLSSTERHKLMDIVFAVEQIVRDTLQPNKINLAALGNMVPHLHWHIIPRWTDDLHFPAPVWGTAQRSEPHTVAAAQLAELKQQLLSL